MSNKYLSAVLLFSMLHPAFSQTLSYVRLTNGLNTPQFEGGRTDFRITDINDDGHPDILTIGDHGSPNVNSGEHGIIVWFGDGLGSFTNYMNGNFGYGGIAVGDVNNDGLKDVGYGMHHNYASGDFGNQLIEVALGDGTGKNWTPWDDQLATHGQSWGMFGVDFGDVNNDGFLDLVSNSFGAGDGVHVYLNNGNGTWTRSFGFMGGNSENLVEFADFNNDGYLDFAVEHEGGTVYLGNGSGGFILRDNGLPAAGGLGVRSGLSTGDVNNDGAADLSMVSAGGGIQVFTFNSSQNQWINISGNLPATGSYSFTQLADMNGDGFLDVVGSAKQFIRIWLGDGKGNWAFNTEFSLGQTATPRAFRVGGDFDHNGRPDIVLLAEIGNWLNYKNYLYCYKEASAAQGLSLQPLFPHGYEKFHPGSAQFIRWLSAVTARKNSWVKIEISAYGKEGPWWLLADSLPNNGNFQWKVPDFGSDSVYLRFTVFTHDSSYSTTTPRPFSIIGQPTGARFLPQVKPEVKVWYSDTEDALKITNPSWVQSLSIFSLEGKLLIRVENPEYIISTRDLRPGIYFYNLRLKDGTQSTSKWIKIRR